MPQASTDDQMMRLEQDSAVLGRGTSSDKGRWQDLSNWARADRGRRLGAIATAVGLSVLYLIFVAHFSTNVPIADDWSVVLIGHDALTGHLSFSLLWTQHLESRMLVVNAIFVLFAWADHLNLRSVVLTSGIFLVVSYGLLLVVFRAYSRRPLTALVVLVLGIAWLSLGDVGNALWAFQLAWYVALLSFTLMVYLLTVSKLPRLLVVCLAAVAASAASFSMVQGLLLWPIGALLILWWTPWTRRIALEFGIWITAAFIISVTFLIGYNFHAAIALCPSRNGCTVGYAVTHPVNDLTYALQLAGDVMPTQSSQIGLHEVVGGLLLAGGFLVIFLVIRERRRTQRNPLPLALVAFALLFDLTITVGRVGFGHPAMQQYVMPQLILLTGILVYACGQARSEVRTNRPLLAWGYAALAIALLAQAATATTYGFDAGRGFQRGAVLSGRIVANANEIPKSELACDESEVLEARLVPPKTVLAVMGPYIAAAEASELSVFDPPTYEHFRQEGAPPAAVCPSS